MKRLLSFITAAFLLTLPAQAASDQKAQAIFEQLMSATIANDYDSFLEVCDERMKAALTKPMLSAVSAQIQPRAKAGYDTEHLGELNQQGFTVHLWRLRCKDGGDDILATLSVKDGKAGGFFLK